MTESGLEEAIAIIEAAIANPTEGLPKEVFYFMTRITPSVNVDLLIRDPEGRTLLAWRSDEFAGSGWHIPGGIVRYKESLETRLEEVAKLEIGRPLRFRKAPIAINQIWKKRETRGHFLSILYECFTDEMVEPNNEGRGPDDAGYLQWHEACPENLIIAHEEVYRSYIESESFEDFSGEIRQFYFPQL